MESAILQTVQTSVRQSNKYLSQCLKRQKISQSAAVHIGRLFCMLCHWAAGFRSSVADDDGSTGLCISRMLSNSHFNDPKHPRQ